MAVGPADEQGLIRAIHLAVHEMAEYEKQKAIEEAVKEFERNLRDMIATAAVKVANYYSVERMGPNLLITVKIGDSKEK